MSSIDSSFLTNPLLISVVFGHPEHAPGVLRTYDTIPTQGSFNVFIMAGRELKEDHFGLCAEFMQASVKYIKLRNPSVNVTMLKSSSQYVDFARLVFAPNVLVASVGSSWALWSAILANSGTVVSLLPWNDLTHHTDIEVLNLPESVTILDGVRTMKNPRDFPDAAREYGIRHGKFSNSVEDRQAVLRFFYGNTNFNG